MKGLSIVLTYYKGEKHIFTCIDSILDSYNSSSKSLALEIVIVIDSMEDADRIESLINSRYTTANVIVSKNQKNIGVSASRNRGLKMIKHQFYTIIDQDDYVKPEYFPTLEKELDPKFAMHIVNGVINYMNEKLEVPIYTFKPQFKFKNLILKETFIYTPGLIVFNASIIPSQQLFIDTSPKYKGCDDWAAYLNVIITKKEVTYKFIDKLLFVYCLHDNDYSNNKEEMIRSSMAVLDFLGQNENLDDYKARLIKKAQKMQDFYILRDVDLASKGRLFRKYPNEFLFQYFFSVFSIDTANKIILKMRHFLKK